MITIDGRQFSIGIKSLRRLVRFANAYSELTEDGTLQEARIGTYYDYALPLAPAFLPLSTYEDFYALVTSTEVFHEITVTVPAGGAIRFTAKFSDITDELIFVTSHSAYWDSLSITLTAHEPALRG